MSFLVNVSDLLSDGNVRESADAELAPSIKEDGILVPLEVYRTSDKGTCWYVKDGHRRLMGAVIAGLNEVPCVEIAPPTNRPDQIAHQYIINEQRKGLTQLEKAEVFRRLKEEFGWPQTRIAKRFTVSEAEVSLALAALQAHPAIRDALLEGKISKSAVEPVLSLSREDQGNIAAAVLRAKVVTKVADVVKTYRQANGIGRGIRPPKVTEAKTRVRTVNPLEAMAVDAAETSLANIKSVGNAIITDSQLRARALAAVSEIIQVAAQLREHLEVAQDVDNVEEFVDWDELANHI